MKLDGRTCQRTLAFVNRVRDAQGKKPLKQFPKGKKRSLTECPLARATGIRVSGFGFGSTLDGRQPPRRYWDTFPQYVQDFIVAFDRGDIPELVA